MSAAKEKTLFTSKGLRYVNSGKLVVDCGYGFYIDLDKRFEFTSSEPHRVSPKTELVETDWYMEIEKSGAL